MTNDKVDESFASTSNRWQHRGQRFLKYLRRILPVGVGILAAFVGLYLYSLYAPPPEPLTLTEVEESVTAIMAEATPAPAYSAQVYDIIFPSLVVVRINDFGPSGDSTAQSSRPGVQFASSAPVPHSGSEQKSLSSTRTDTEVQTQEEFGVGSGVVINADGAILTAYHVVERATTIDITFADGTETGAAIVAVEPANDIAVLQAERLPEVFAPATLGNPGALRIGDEAYAVGNPLGLAGSISAGVISGLDRTYRRLPNQPPLERLIQFDTAVNLGSAGGPLLNRNGEVVGIVVGPVNPTAEEIFIGIGFAVRIDEAGTAAGVPEH